MFVSQSLNIRVYSYIFNSKYIFIKSYHESFEHLIFQTECQHVFKIHFIKTFQHIKTNT